MTGYVERYMDALVTGYLERYMDALVTGNVERYGRSGDWVCRVL